VAPGVDRSLPWLATRDRTAWGLENVQVRILTIDAEAVVQGTVDALPSKIDDVRVIAEWPIDVEGATVHVGPEGFDAGHRDRAQHRERDLDHPGPDPRDRGGHLVQELVKNVLSVVQTVFQVTVDPWRGRQRFYVTSDEGPIMAQPLPVESVDSISGGLTAVLRRRLEPETRRRTAGSEFLTPSFVRRHTDFHSLEALCRASPADRDTPGAIERLPPEERDSFVARRSAFDSWAELKRRAARAELHELHRS
jgi:hypothetical protein